MRTHWRYLCYVLRHKRFVFEAGLKRGGTFRWHWASSRGCWL